jgi:hypothetical protein
MVNIEKSSLVHFAFSPHDKTKRIVARCSGSLVTRDDGGFLNVGSGECLPNVPEGGLTVVTTSRKDDLHAESRSDPVENKFGTQVEALQITTAQVNKEGIIGQEKEKEIMINAEKNKEL